ncbi:MAG TPA: CRISPR system precrRNA processing endoribonuclease RAMP protein Cas6 [Peptococcaceae bacterium]|jgi:CRISPR-associated endoribonuclease Cas6|nr:CRISPR system precrRNA processing endoribonuclease RAMP protein Cas6 [Peptococcaceae bacterium]
MKNMLQKIVVQCKYGGEQKANYNWGSLFHGVLLQALPPEIADTLHQSRLRPFSQYVLPRPDDRHLTWIIGLWDTGLAGYIVQTVMSMNRIELQQKGITLEVVEVQRNTQSVQDYFSRFFTSSTPCRRYEVEFLTPSTHKQNGGYALFPGTELIINSIIRRYSAFVQDVSLEDAEAIKQIARHTRIVRYALHSSVYYLENIKITGYMGRLTLVISGPEQLARLTGALLCFAEYCGLGVKTALGMGAVRVKQIN